MNNGSPNPSKDDPDTWPAERIADEVAYTLSDAGRSVCQPREIAFAREIKRLSGLLQFARKYGS